MKIFTVNIFTRFNFSRGYSNRNENDARKKGTRGRKQKDKVVG